MLYTHFTFRQTYTKEDTQRSTQVDAKNEPASAYYEY
jgi:hypothetical protein